MFFSVWLATSAVWTAPFAMSSDLTPFWPCSAIAEPESATNNARQLMTNAGVGRQRFTPSMETSIESGDVGPADPAIRRPYPLPAAEGQALRSGPRRRGDLDRLSAPLPVRLRRRRRVAQEPLGVQRAHAAGAGGGDRLAVGVIDQIADGEDTG